MIIESATVVIPCYGRGAALEECLASIAKYCPSLAVVVVDDGTQDDSVLAVVEAADSKLVISYRRNSTNEGACAARNLGLELVTTEWVMFLDSDDRYLVGVRSLLRSDSSADIVHGVVVRVKEDGEYIEKIGRPWDGNIAGASLYHWHTNGAIWRTNFVRSLGGWDTRLYGSQDWEVQVRAKLAFAQTEFCDIEIANWIEHSGQRITSSSFDLRYCLSAIAATERLLNIALTHKRVSINLILRLLYRKWLHVFEIAENVRRFDKVYALRGGGKVTFRWHTRRVLVPFIRLVSRLKLRHH